MTGIYSFERWERLPSMLQEILTLRCGGEDPARSFASSVDLGPLARRIRQPLLVVGAEADPVAPLSHAQRLAAEAPCAELLSLPGGDHLGANRRWLWEDRAADWLLAHLI